MIRRFLIARFVIFTFVVSFVLPNISYAQAQYEFIKLADGTVVKLSQNQLQLLINQPNIMYTQSTQLPALVGEQIAIPIPQQLGGGYLIGTPEAIASALSNTGIAAGATSQSVLGATASAGSIATSGSAAGATVAAGVTAGTVALTAGIAAAVIGAVIAITADEDGGGFAVTHITTSHH